MKSNTITFKSFNDLAKHVKTTQHQADIEAAKRLRKTQHLRKPGTLAVASREQ